MTLAQDEKAYEAWSGYLYQTYYYPRDQIDNLSNDFTTRGRNIPQNDRDMLKNIIIVKRFAYNCQSLMSRWCLKM